MKIGRNEPCPCGSGKKYKQCCLNKKIERYNLSFNSKSDALLLKHSTKNYGLARLSKDFFERNPLKDISAARLVYSNLFYPKIDKIASKLTRKIITRGDEEAKKINKESNPENLLKMMEQGIDPLNYWLLKKKILGFSKYLLPKIIEKLKENLDDAFVELSISLIYESKIDCSSQLLEMLDEIKDPYTLSLICLLLGLIGTRESIQPVWDYYHFFKYEYPEENLEQGPLLALHEFKIRFGLN